MSSYPLAMVFPFLRRLRVPVGRDQAMLLVIAVNELFLGIDTYLAHSISGTIVPREWIPIIFGVTAGVLLGLAGLISLRYRMAANLLATGVFTASIIVGVLGSYFHLYRALQPYAQAGLPGVGAAALRTHYIRTGGHLGDERGLARSAF
jgi:hypothetical protein